MKVDYEGMVIEVVQGNIAHQPDLDAIVNAANAKLLMGGGVAGAIHGAAGPGLEDECRPLAPIRPGEAVITGGHNLPNKHVVHTLGPIWKRDKPEEVHLADCYRNSLIVADEAGVTSIGFPAISTGIFGYPVEEASEVALMAIRESAGSLANIKLVRMVLYGPEDFEVHLRALERVFAD